MPIEVWAVQSHHERRAAAAPRSPALPKEVAVISVHPWHLVVLAACVLVSAAVVAGIALLVVHLGKRR